MVVVSYFHYDTFLQNLEHIVTKYNSFFITKCDKSLLQSASRFLLQNGTVFITKCVGRTLYVNQKLQNMRYLGFQNNLRTLIWYLQ